MRLKEASSFKTSSGLFLEDSFKVARSPLDPIPDTPQETVLRKELSGNATRLPKPIRSSSVPVVAVIGVGYVGSRLVSAFAPHYNVIAFDISESLLKSLAPNSVNTIPSSGQASRPDNSINTTFLQEAIKLIDLYAAPRATIVIESSVSVGMTGLFLGPLIKSKGLKAGMSRERVDPGRTEPSHEMIPKIISGLDDITSGSLFSIFQLYSKVFQNIVVVSRPKVGEMMKLYENCQRMICIAYANEMADACIKLGINPFEVSQATGTKPFGYLPLHPSLGVGGSCIPVNPYYLLINNDFPLLKAATEAMHRRPADLGDRAMTALLNKNPSKFIKRIPRVLVVGVAFKRGQSLITMSPSVELMKR